MGRKRGVVSAEAMAALEMQDDEVGRIFLLCLYAAMRKERAKFLHDGE
jgi:hypothetical protein